MYDKEHEMVCDILRIINNCNISINDLKNTFSSVELGIIRKLYIDESIINMFDEKSCNEYVRLTKKGKFILFSHDNRDAIEEFAKLLEKNNYSPFYLGDFLKSSDLDRLPSEILSVSDYELFVYNLKQLEDSRVSRRLMLRNNRNIG